MPSEEFEKQIKSKLDRLEVPPGESVWTGLQAQLARRKRKGILLWWQFGGLSSLLVFALVLTFIGNGNKQPLPLPSSFPGSSSILTEKQGPLFVGKEKAKSIPSPKGVHVSPSFRPGPVGMVDSDSQKQGAMSKLSPGIFPLVEKTIIASSVQPLSPAYTSQVLGVHFMAENRWELSDKIEAGLPSQIHQDLSFKRSWWLDLALGADIAGKGGPVGMQGGENFLAATNRGADFTEIEGWGLANPISPIGNALPVYRITYPRLIQSVSASLGYRFHPRWSIDGGMRLMFSENGRVELGLLPSDFQPEGEIDLAALSMENTEIYRFSQQQMEIPLHLNFHLKNKGRHQLSLGMGPSLNASLISADQFVQIEASSPLANEGDLPRHQQWNLHLDYRLNYEYFVNSQMKIQVGPEFQQQVSAAFSGRSAPEQMRYRLGIRAGISWNPWR